MSCYIPDIANYPHLVRRMEYELRRDSDGCNHGCNSKRICEKYAELVKREKARDGKAND